MSVCPDCRRTYVSRIRFSTHIGRCIARRNRIMRELNRLRQFSMYSAYQQIFQNQSRIPEYNFGDRSCEYLAIDVVKSLLQNIISVRNRTEIFSVAHRAIEIEAEKKNDSGICNTANILLGRSNLNISIEMRTKLLQRTKESIVSILCSLPGRVEIMTAENVV